VNFGLVLRTVSGFLAGRGYRFALIGGVALAAYGLVRTTLDLDLVVESRCQDDLVAFLESLGFGTLHRSSGYSNHLHRIGGRFEGISNGTALGIVSMSSKRVFEMFGEEDLPTTAADVEALRRHRPRGGDEWLAQVTALAAQVPEALAGRRERRTFAGLAPFEL
jgi:hypothetical protein